MIEVATADINSFASKPEQGDSGALAEEKPLFRTAFELIKANPEQPKDIQGPEPDLYAELKAAKEEIARLQGKNRALAEENKQLKELASNLEASDPKWFCEMLESISMKVLAPILEHEATDQRTRNIARDLGTIPDELSWYVNKGQKSYQDAIIELRPLLDVAKNKLLEKKKRGAAEGKNVHRAKLLLEKLELRGEIRIAQAVDIIDGDEGQKPDYTVARRAMKGAAKMEPNRAEYSRDELGSILKRKS